MVEVRILVVLNYFGPRLTMNGSKQLLLILHQLIPLLESNALISIDIQSADNGDYFSFTCSETVHSTEIHDVIIVKHAFPSIINSLE